MVDKKKRRYSHPRESYRILFRKSSKKKRGRSSQKKLKSKQSPSLIIRKFTENALVSGAEVKSFFELGDAFQFIEGLFKKSGKKSLAVSPDLKYLSQIQNKFPLLEGLIIKDAANAEAGLVMADYGIAETGTLVHFDQSHEGKNVWTLPPFCICLVQTSNIISGFEKIAKRISRHLVRTDIPFSHVSFITGPSQTADIECQLTIGVQGPSRLLILLI